MPENVYNIHAESIKMEYYTVHLQVMQLQISAQHTSL